MRIAIIGAGLSGLYAAYRLQGQHDITIYEARPRLGGRVLTLNGFDMGPSWVWSHQKRILEFIRELGLEAFAQHEKGHGVYETPHNVSLFPQQPSPPSGRVSGGIGAIINALHERLENVEIRLETAVISLRQSDDEVEINGCEVYDRVISTLPPRVAEATLTYDPPLSESQCKALQRIPTWMGHSAKCVIGFERPFWREMGLSGLGISYRGPLGEIHDACTAESPALFGFVTSAAAMETIEADVKAQLLRMFGEDAANPTTFQCVDWRVEPYTAVMADAAPRSSHPDYGLKLSVWDERLLFSGTETAFEEGGYLEGALVSVEQTLVMLGV